MVTATATATDNHLAIGTKGDRIDGSGMALEGFANGYPIQAPQPHRGVTTATDNHLTIGAKGDRIDSTGTAQGVANHLAIGAKGDRIDGIRMALEGPANGSALQTPQPHRGVIIVIDAKRVAKLMSI